MNGFIEVKTGLGSYQFLRALTGAEWDLVGFYYTSDMHSSPLVNLYDVYTGRVFQAGKAVETLDSLSLNPHIKAIRYHSYSGPSDRFKEVLGRALLQYIQQDVGVGPDLAEQRLDAILSKLGTSKAQGVPYHGYLFVNQILSSLTPSLKPEPQRLSLAVTRATIRHFKRTGPAAGSQEAGPFTLAAVLELFRKAYLERPALVEWFEARGGAAGALEAPPSPDPTDVFACVTSSSVPVSPPPPPPTNLLPAISHLSELYNDILSYMEQGLPPIIYLSDHVRQLNRLRAEAGLLPIFDTTSSLLTGGGTSTAAVLRLDTLSPEEEQPGSVTIQIETEGVQNIVLPIRSANLTNLSPKQLQDILIYLDALPDTGDRRYVPLQLQVGKALAAFS